MSLRDPEFIEALDGFYATSQYPEEPRLPHSQRMRVAIMHIGAPAGGMNAATRAAVRYCLRQGHKPFAVHNGFLGLLDDVVVSGAEGVAKPDPAIYAIVVARAGLPAADLVFVDDKEANVVGAIEAGLDGVLFTTADDLRGQLRDRGLPV